jgi:hypothetical protein
MTMISNNTMPYFLRKNVTTVEKKSKNAFAQDHMKRHWGEEHELEEKSGEPQEMEISEEMINHITWRILENLRNFLTHQLKEKVRHEDEDGEDYENEDREEDHEDLVDLFHRRTGMGKRIQIELEMKH